MDDGDNLTAHTEILPLQYNLPLNIAIEYTPKDFIQVNHGVNVAMVNQAISWLTLKAEDVVLDLFCGLGNFTLPIAKKGK